MIGLAIQSIDSVLVPLLSRLLAGDRGQVFLFGPAGEPFWAARTPLTRTELVMLGEAIDLLEALAVKQPRPFVGCDPSQRFVVVALDARQDLFLVVFADPPTGASAEVRAEAVREAVRPAANDIRRIWNLPGA